jgi:chromosome segregation ATPase
MTAPNASMLWPTYALRAWLTALLGQVERSRAEIDTRVEYHEKEIAHLQAQKQRSGPVIESLREAIGSVDDVLRRTRDTEIESERSRSEARERAQEAARERSEARERSLGAASERGEAQERSLEEAEAKKPAASPSEKPQPAERKRS